MDVKKASGEGGKGWCFFKAVNDDRVEVCMC